MDLSRIIPVVISLLAVWSSGCIGTDDNQIWHDSENADFFFPDPAGDTKWGGHTKEYNGAGASAMDVVAVRVYNGPEHLEFHLALKDLDAHREHLHEPDFHAQYSLSFAVNGDLPGYSTRASFSGSERAGDEDGQWRFNLHNQHTDTWPEAIGEIDASTIKWQIPHDQFKAVPGDMLTDWSVSTWASMDNKDQYGDKVSTSNSFELDSSTD